MAGQSADARQEFDPEDLSELAHRTLIIGDLKRWRAAGRDTGAFEHFKYTEPSELTADTLRDFDPEIILSPLVGDAFDVFEVAQTLQKLGFQGRYRALCFNVPNIDIIRNDVIQIAPDLDFDLLQVPPAQPKVASNDR